MSKFAGVFFMVLLFSGSWVLGQYELSPNKKLDQYNFDHWDSDEGLPVNSIIHIIQAKNGYIWFVSYGGITRFNGIEFYTFSSFNASSIINNSYTHIYEDDSGVIWASSSGGGITAIDGEKLRTYTTEDGLPSNFVEEAVQDAMGRLWVATSNGLYYKEGERFINHDTPSELKASKLKSIDCDEFNQIWAATVDKGVYKFTRNNVLATYTKDNGILSNHINYVKCENGAVWIGTNMGLSIIKEDSIASITVDDGLQSGYITSSIVDNNGGLWIGSYRGFCRIIGSQYSYFSPAHPLYGQDITSMLQDNEGNLWLGTYRRGLYKLWDGKFTNYGGLIDDEHSSFVVHSVIQQNDSTLIVVQQEGVDILNSKTNSIKRLDLNYDVSTSYKSGMLDNKGNLWISSLHYLLKYNDKKTTVFNSRNGLIHENVRLTYEDSKGNIWVGTTNGITVITPTGYTNYSVKDGLSHEYIMSIEEDGEGAVWIGTRNGLNHFKDGKFAHYFADDGMAGDFVFKTYFDDKGAMWICGNAGLTRYKNGKFTSITTADGLASNTVFQILEDDEGYYWITTNQKGITVFKILEQELNDFADGKISKVNSIIYTQEDGLKSTAATSSATSLKASDGTLWFATNNGVEMIDPSKIRLNTGKPPVVIEAFLVNGEDVDMDSAIIIPSGKQRVVVKFSALSYVSPRSIEYKYKLLGFDDDWQTSHGKRETSYTNLPYGEYTFMVIAANSDGIWNENGATVTFYIKPAFYETNAFALGIVLLALLIGIVVYNLRIKSLKRSQRELAKLVAERTSEIVHQKEEIEAQKEAIEIQQEQIEHKNKELHKINLRLEDIVEERTEQLEKAYKDLLRVNKELDTFIYRSVHDVRGPIARLQGLSHLISLETTDDRIHELVRMLNLTANEMNDVFYSLLNIVRLKASELNIRQIDVKEVITDVISKLLPKDRNDDVRIEVNIDQDVRLFSDKDIVEIIFYQLVDNALKFRKAEGIHIVKVNCTHEGDNQIRIEVSDNGISISEEVSDKIFEMFFVGQDHIPGSGLGLYTVRTAVKVLRGKVRLLKNSVDEGTIFEVILPSNIS